MTQHDLSTMLREHVARDEPVRAPDPWVSVRTGRRQLRARRLVVGGATAAVLAGAAVTSAAWLTGDDGPAGTRGDDPAPAHALEEYDAHEMPRILDERVRPVLERSVPDLGSVTFLATDAQRAKLPRRHYDKASQMSVWYGSPTREFRVDVGRRPAEGSPSLYCSVSLADGESLECEVSTGPDGEVVTSTLMALRPAGPVGAGRLWMVVTAEQLETDVPDNLWFSRAVQVVKSETLVTYAAEFVKAPTRQAAEDAFEVPPSDLTEIATDPALVIPPPPTDDSGCGPWTLDPGITSSC